MNTFSEDLTGVAVAAAVADVPCAVLFGLLFKSLLTVVFGRGAEAPAIIGGGNLPGDAERTKNYLFIKE